jgi:hypothetical protein
MWIERKRCSGRTLSSARCRRTSASDADGASGGFVGGAANAVSNANGSLPLIFFGVAASADEGGDRGRGVGQERR